jgi:hypothetical protein
MGWSCRADAGRTMRKWIDACVAQTGSQNNYTANGQGYFWEVSRTEHRDGAITGTIWRHVPGPDPARVYCRKAGSFRIDGDGTIARAPAFLKQAAQAPDAPMFQLLPGSGGMY